VAVLLVAVVGVVAVEVAEEEAALLEATNAALVD